MNDAPTALPLDRASLFRIAAVHRTPPVPIAGDGITDWLLTKGPRIAREVELFGELCWRLVGSGVGLWRATLHYGTLHPQIQGLAVRWWRDREITEEIHIAHGAILTSEYTKSPIRPAIERGIAVRHRLDDGEAAGYPLLESIRRTGGTDYLALPLNPMRGRFPVATWATDRPGGFAEADIAALHGIAPALAAIVDTRASRRVSTNLLDTYLGIEAGRRILAGQVQRGQGEGLNAVIMATDLRGFTALSDRLSGAAMIALLDEYFEAVTGAIHERDGDVLKFIGDGVLAIFPVGEEGDFTSIAVHALDAGRTILARLDERNVMRRAAGLAQIRIGIGLHLGEVIYGNVGGFDRLDFTVIGPAVNLAARLESLTKRLMRPLLTSQAFAAACPLPLASLGYHPVRGFSEPEEVFGLPESC